MENIELKINLYWEQAKIKKLTSSELIITPILVDGFLTENINMLNQEKSQGIKEHSDVKKRVDTLEAKIEINRKEILQNVRDIKKLLETLTEKPHFTLPLLEKVNAREKKAVLFESRQEKFAQKLETVLKYDDSFLIRSLLYSEFFLFKKSWSFPIHDEREKLENLIITSKVSLIISPTGTGKSTFIPLYLLNDQILKGKANPQKRIVIAQPRRNAATSINGRLVEIRNSFAGSKHVSYHIGNDKQTKNSETILESVTYGILVERARQDARFGSYSIIFVDEVHESCPELFYLLSLLKSAVLSNPNLTVVLMSATVERSKFKGFFPDLETHVISMQKMYNIEMSYSCLIGDPISKCTQEAKEVLKTQQYNPDRSPNILIFLPTVSAINEACELLEVMCLKEGYGHVEVFPFHSKLPELDKSKIQEQENLGVSPVKIIVATNIAETSLTIKNLGTVIDSGLELLVSKDLKTNVIEYSTVHISNCSAIQRKGRVGRVSNGKYIPLYSMKDEALMKPYREAKYESLDFFIMQLITRGFDRKGILDFTWFERPTDDILEWSINRLYDLELVQDNVFGVIELSYVGKLIQKFKHIGINASQSKFLLFSRFLDTKNMEMAITIVCFQTLTIFLTDADEDFNEEDDGFEDIAVGNFFSSGANPFNQNESSMDCLSYLCFQWYQSFAFKNGKFILQKEWSNLNSVNSRAFFEIHKQREAIKLIMLQIHAPDLHQYPFPNHTAIFANCFWFQIAIYQEDGFFVILPDSNKRTKVELGLLDKVGGLFKFHPNKHEFGTLFTYQKICKRKKKYFVDGLTVTSLEVIETQIPSRWKSWFYSLICFQ
jgi:HrpA-like RNA helicase